MSCWWIRLNILPPTRLHSGNSFPCWSDITSTYCIIQEHFKKPSTSYLVEEHEINHWPWRWSHHLPLCCGVACLWRTCLVKMCGLILITNERRPSHISMEKRNIREKKLVSEVESYILLKNTRYSLSAVRHPTVSLPTGINNWCNRTYKFAQQKAFICP